MGHLLTWDGHDLATLSVVIALWRSLDGGGGWVASSMVVVDGLRRRWWWWEGSNDVATFEPRLPHLGSHVLGVGYIVLWFVV